MVDSLTQKKNSWIIKFGGFLFGQHSVSTPFIMLKILPVAAVAPLTLDYFVLWNDCERLFNTWILNLYTTKVYRHSIGKILSTASFNLIQRILKCYIRPNRSQIDRLILFGGRKRSTK